MSSYRRLPLPALAVLACLFLSACSGDDGPTGPSGPQGPEGPAGPQGPAGMPAAQGLAGVDGTGTLLRDVNAVSAERVDVGRYRVTFSSAVNVAAGYFVVTPGLNSSCNTMASAEVSANNSVWVSFSSGGLNFVDCSFSLVVF